jgi:hypothetical protein
MARLTRDYERQRKDIPVVRVDSKEIDFSRVMIRKYWLVSASSFDARFLVYDTARNNAFHGS